MSSSGSEPISNGPLRRAVIVRNPDGLHMRPAAAFAELAARFESRVRVSRDDQTVDGKFWPDLMLLAAEKGTTLVLEVDGHDAAAAIEALTDVLNSFAGDAARANGDGHD